MLIHYRLENLSLHRKLVYNSFHFQTPHPAHIAPGQLAGDRRAFIDGRKGVRVIGLLPGGPVGVQLGRHGGLMVLDLVQEPGLHLSPGKTDTLYGLEGTKLDDGGEEVHRGSCAQKFTPAGYGD